jgi:hypothetical protein
VPPRYYGSHHRESGARPRPRLLPHLKEFWALRLRQKKNLEKKFGRLIEKLSLPSPHRRGLEGQQLRLARPLTRVCPLSPEASSVSSARANT